LSWRQHAPILTTVAVLCATNLVIGWSLDYRSAGAHAVFWAFAALTAVPAWTLARILLDPAGTLDLAIASSVLAFALIVVCGLTLGALGWLTLGAYAALQAALAALAIAAGRTRPARDDSSGPSSELAHLPAWTIGIAGALVAFAVAFGVVHSPLTLYDSVSYHLFFPARWLQDHQLSIVPTPFSDEAQAYAPANGELFLLWLMLPFHGDLLARIGQLPFALLAAVTVYALARRLGAPPSHAVYAPAFLLLSRPIVEQAIGANVDLVCAATFLTSIYLGLAAIERNRVRDWLLCGVSLGLFFGTKYVALVYAPVFALLALAGRPRLRMLWTFPGLAAFAAPWYLRNWIVAGSPIYPATLEIAGVTLARGAFSREAMLNTVFHTSDPKLLPAILAHAFGPTLFAVWIPAAAVGGVLLARRGRPQAFVALLPYLMLPLFWFGFPVNIDSRFFMPAVAPALVPFAFAFTSRRSWNAAVHAAYVAAMAWIIVGVRRDVPAALPWFMAGWLALDGLMTPRFLGAFAALAVSLAAVWQLARTRLRWAMPTVVCLLAGTTTALAVGTDRWCAPGSCEYLDVTSPRIRPTLVAAWQWLAANTQHSTVAYTGINLPYPLSGDRLTNRVVYANIDGRPRWRFHDYDRAYRSGRFDPLPPVLATSSGELMPVGPHAGPRDDAVRPRYERMQGLRDAWIANLRQMHVDVLFVSALSAYEIDYVWHNEGGFPIEDEWASAAPGTFRRIYENGQVHVYSVHPAGDGR
jgi:4-amino-4-deoxy-L-arabinose transferase-like glycosyltransferase